MSDLTPAAEALDEDLHLLMHDAFFPTEAVKERVWGSTAGAPRTVEESRVLYRRPIVEAFAASGAETLAEFPERVRFLSDAYYTLLHERDMAKAEADRYHAGLVVLRESEHNARLQVQEAAVVNAHIAAERDRLIREAALGPDTEKPLREEARQLRAERDRYKALAEQQSATVAEGAKTIGRLQADLERVKTEWNSARADLAKQLSDSSAEEDRLRVELDGAQQQLRHVIELKDRQVVELKQANAKIKDLAEKLTLARNEAGELYATETRLRERVKWAMARIQDLLLGGDL